MHTAYIPNAMCISGLHRGFVDSMPVVTPTPGPGLTESRKTECGARERCRRASAVALRLAPLRLGHSSSGGDVEGRGGGWASHIQNKGGFPTLTRQAREADGRWGARGGGGVLTRGGNEGWAGVWSASERGRIGPVSLTLRVSEEGRAMGLCQCPPGGSVFLP